MTVTEYKADTEKEIATAMIVDKELLAAVAPRWDIDIYGHHKHLQLIGDWCVKHFTKYNKPPGAEIESVFKQWATKKKRDKATVEMIDRILSQLSGKYKQRKKQINSKRMISLAEELFRRIQILKMADQLTNNVQAGNLELATETASKFAPLIFTDSNTVSTAKDAAKAQKEKPPEVLVSYDGALGNFFANQLYRSGFVCFSGGSKVGKTWWLIDVAAKAVQQGNKVWYYSVGDMTLSESLDRLACNMGGLYSMFGTKWKKGKRKRLTGRRRITVPTDIAILNPDTAWRESEPEFEMDFTKKKYLSIDDLNEKKMAKFWRPHMDDGCSLQVRMASTGSKSVEALRADLITSAVMPDVVVIDYADIMKAPASSGDTRHGHNEVWKGLRRISQDFDILVVTATQRKKAHVKNLVLQDALDYSEDGRKNDHVTAMIGLNQTVSMKRSGVYALNYMLARSIEFDSDVPVYSAGNLSIARPAIISRFV